ncbi:MAG: hypothetical protein ACRDLS_02465, partial [Solirubrobacteraceae bacterium]
MIRRVRDRLCDRLRVAFRHMPIPEEASENTLWVGWPGASQPPAPSDPGVTVSRHRALLTRRQVRRSR